MQVNNDLNLYVKRVRIYQFKEVISVARILNDCGKDMAREYGLHHWDNHILKSLLIVMMCLVKNQVYLLMKGKKAVATFQMRKEKETLFFEKLAVSPYVSGKGYGSYCMMLIEKKAKVLGCKKVRMEVYDKSKHAIEFYLHKGYLQTEIVETLKYRDVVMEKVVGK